MSGLRDKALAVLGAVLGLVLLPLACFELRSVGPASRVVFYDYFPIVELGIYGLVAVLGAALGGDVPRWLGDPANRPALPRIKLAALAAVVIWVAAAQVLAFPAGASIAERDRWARDHVREYPALKRVVAGCPEVLRDAGRIVAIAPTSNDQHTFAREMNGDDMRFTLDVIGSNGAGRFRADCTLDSYNVFDWRSGQWSFAGRETRIDKVASRVP